jgi:crossover junction endodeoxyribonuclease RuvC
MIIIGIDPGTARVGLGVIEKKGSAIRAVHSGLIETSKDLPPVRRLRIIHDAVSAAITEYGAQVMAVEKLFFNKNVTTAMSVSEARGVILLSAEFNGIDIHEYTPLQVKQALTGYGRAEKKQVQDMIKLVLGLKQVPQPDDVADALAIAVCCASSIKMERLGKK